MDANLVRSQAQETEGPTAMPTKAVPATAAIGFAPIPGSSRIVEAESIIKKTKGTAPAYPPLRSLIVGVKRPLLGDAEDPLLLGGQSDHLRRVAH